MHSSEVMTTTYNTTRYEVMTTTYKTTWYHIPKVNSSSIGGGGGGGGGGDDNIRSSILNICITKKSIQYFKS
jgi:hypothetical protein